MKSFSLFVLSVIFHSGLCVVSPKINSLAPFTVNGILEEYFAPNSPKVDLIYYGSESGKSESQVRQILRLKKDSIAIEVKSPREKKLRGSSVLAFDSVQNFKAESKNIGWLSNPKARNRHLVHIPNATVADLADIEDGFLIDHVSFLINESEKSIDLVTSFMFRPNACRSIQFETINRFHQDTMKWENSNFFPKKYENFNGCPLVVGETGTDLYGITAEVIEMLSKALNFKKVFKSIVKDSKLQLQAKYFEGVDIIRRLGISDGFPGFVSGFPFVTLSFAFIVPQGQLYTQYEKMFMMFSNETWWAIIITLLIAAATVLVINVMSETVKNFVFGRYIREPMLNIASLFLSGGQYKTPTRNFARYLLMLFIIWCLIIRTCYQSKLFELLQADVRQPRPTTFEELSERNYKLFDVTNTGQGLIEKYNLNLKFGNWNASLADLWTFVAEPDNKAITFAVKENFKLYLSRSFRTGTSPLQCLEENIFTMSSGLVFRSFSPFFEEFNEKIAQMVAAGLTGIKIERLTRQFVTPEEIGPQVLSMEHLEVAFLICFIPIIACIAVFLVEISIRAMKKFLQKWIFYCFVSAHIKKYSHRF